jgi:hypothetical protein
MAKEGTFRRACCFADSRPVFDVKYDIETRTRRLLDREPGAELIFRGRVRGF